MDKRLVGIKKRMNVILDGAESEKRALTPTEQEEFNTLKLERDVLNVRIEKRNLGVVDSHAQAVRERSFAEAACVLRDRGDVSKFGNWMDGKGMLISHERALTVIDTASSAPLVPLTIGDIIQPLEKGLILDKLGCKIQYGLVGDFVLPIVSGVEATIEDENAELNDSKIDISKLKPTPKRVAIKIPVSNDAIDQTNDALLEIVLSGLIMALARLLNKWQFSPTKISTKASEGVFVKTTPNIQFTGSLSWKDVCALKAAVLKSGVVVDGTACYVCSASTYADLESTPRESSDSRMILEDGKINGYPVYITEYAGDDILGFGVFSYSLVGQWGKMRLTVDPYTGSGKNITYFVLNTKFDQLPVRPEAFAIAKKKTV